NTTSVPGCKVYVTVPTSNGAPIQWTPSAGTNFANASTIPPVTTSHNSSSTVGQIDQYVHPLPTMPAATGIVSVQHCMDLLVDSGTRDVASDVGGVAGTGITVTNTSLQYVLTVYDTNPGGGGAWAQGAFPLAAGPKVTA